METQTPMLCLMLFFSLVVAHQQVLGDDHNPKQTLKWAKTSQRRVRYSTKESTTHLEFYFHDTVSGANATAVRVAEANTTEKSPTFFGAIVMADDPLTEGPEPKSKIVGRAQGFYTGSGQHEFSLTMGMSFCFVDGIYNNSCLSTFGRNPASKVNREITIIGGSGLFRMARGYALAHTHWFDNYGDVVVGYNVTVYH